MDLLGIEDGGGALRGGAYKIPGHALGPIFQQKLEASAGTMPWSGVNTALLRAHHEAVLIWRSANY